MKKKRYGKILSLQDKYDFRGSLCSSPVSTEETAQREKENFILPTITYVQEATQKRTLRTVVSE